MINYVTERAKLTKRVAVKHARQQQLLRPRLARLSGDHPAGQRQVHGCSALPGARLHEVSAEATGQPRRERRVERDQADVAIGYLPAS